jgi:chaperone modulatory protein CbpM
MKTELTEVIWLDEHVEYSLEELAERSHLAHAEIIELFDSGAISPGDSHALEMVRIAARLRSDFEVNLQGAALAVTLLRRISDLEKELRGLRARTAHTL